MEQVSLGLGYIGLFAMVSLSASGSAIGCARAGMAADRAILETETGHGRYLGVAALPSTQAILGIVLTFILRNNISAQRG